MWGKGRKVEVCREWWINNFCFVDICMKAHTVTYTVSTPCYVQGVHALLRTGCPRKNTTLLNEYHSLMGLLIEMNL